MSERKANKKSQNPNKELAQGGGQIVPSLSAGELVLYATDDGQARFHLRADGGTVWLSQLELAELFQTTVPNINIHIKNVLAEGELQAGATIKEDLMVRTEGGRQVRRPLMLYAVTRKTAAEIVVERAAPGALTNWKASRVRKTDVIVAKNYLSQDEIREMDRCFSTTPTTAPASARACAWTTGASTSTASSTSTNGRC